MGLACAPPVNIAGEPLKAPKAGDVFEGVHCSAVRPQTEPDLMAWDPGSRANLTRLRRKGVVAVRYEAKGCNVELELLPQCIGAASTYEFSTYSANERKIAHNASELFAELPVGAARLSGKLKGNRVLRTDYMLAGQYALPPSAIFKAADLSGSDCGRATHVVSAVYVGAFALGAGESRLMEGGASLLGASAGGRSTADIEVLGDEGSADACRTSQGEGKPDDRCSVPLRIALLRLEAPPAPAVREAPGPAREPQSAPPRPSPAAVAPTTVAASERKPVAGPTTVAAPTTASDSTALFPRDSRRTMTARAPAVVSTELAALTRLLGNTSRQATDRPALLRRIADAYGELARGSAHGSTAATDARRAMFETYQTLMRDYPNYPALDEVTYIVALEHEAVADLKNARGTYYELIKKYPSSRYVPRAYLAFGELFASEAIGDPPKWSLAAAAYKEVLKFPPPANTAFVYAAYRLAEAERNGGDNARGIDGFKRAIAASEAHPSLPGSSAIADAARKELLRAK